MKYIFTLIFATQFLISQEYIKMIDNGSHSIEDIIDSANLHFDTVGKGKGTGYFSFKRWQYMAERLQNTDGYITSKVDLIKELQEHEAYLNNNQSQSSTSQSNWIEMGPTDWNNTTGWNPGVGRITGIAIDPSDENHILIGANTGGVWRTTDGAQNWTPLLDYFSNLDVYSVAFDPLDSSTYYFGSVGGAVYKSTDSGATWSHIPTGSSSTILKILIHPTDTNIMYVCSRFNGFYRTNNGGASWVSITNDNQAYDIEFKPGNPNIVYASGSGFYKSTDNGINFSSITGFNSGAKMIGVSPNDPNKVYVLEANRNIFGGFYKSDDEGSSFTELNHSGKNYFGYDTAGNDNRGQAPRDMDIAVNPINANEVHIAGILTWRSTDGGATFSCTSDWVPDYAKYEGIGYCHADVDFLLFYGTDLYVGSDGGIFKSSDTSNVNANYYEDLTKGLGIRQFYKIGISQTSDVVISGGSQDNGTSVLNSTDGWRDWLGADGMETFVDKTDPHIIYGTSQFGKLYRSDDGGLNVDFLIEPGRGEGNWVTPFEQDPTDPNTIYVGYDRIHKSTNKGITWSTISNLYPLFDNLKIAPSNNQVMLASSSKTLYKTENGGATTTWPVIKTFSNHINSIAIHPTNPLKIAVCMNGSQKVQISNDGGTTWENYNKNLPDFSALSLTWDDNGNDGLYVGMFMGIYYIDNNLTDWIPYNNFLPNVRVNELEINNSNGRIYAGTYGRGLWSSPKLDPAVSVNEFDLNKVIQLYPNPVQEILNLNIKQGLEMEISIFDLQGRKVVFLPKESISSSLKVDVSHLTSGAYFVRINSNKGSITQKILKK